MMKKQKEKINIKIKLINYLIVKGKKTKSEKIVFNNIKTLQMVSKKPLKKLFQLALISATPIFKVATIIQKKKRKKKPKIVPTFITTKTSRIFFAIKFIVTTAKKKKNQNGLSQKLSEEILLILNDKSSTIETKKGVQKQVFLNRNLFTRYRWGNS